MTLRDFEYVIAVAEEQHFGRAAARCHVSQPTLSAQVKKLEDLLGVALFERTRRRVAITPAGREILACCRRALAEADNVRDIARAHRDPLAGRFRLGVIPTVSPSLVPGLLGGLRECCPLLRLVLVEETTDRLLLALDAGELDAAIVATDETGGRREEAKLYDEAFLAAVPAGSPLAGRDRATAAALRQADLLLLADGHCLRDQALAVCGREAVAADEGLPGQNLRAASLSTLVQLVAAGYGVTLVPARARDALAAEARDVVFLPVAGGQARRTVRIVYRSGYPRRAAIEAIAGIVRAAS